MPRDREATWLEPKEKQRMRNVLLSAPEAGRKDMQSPRPYGMTVIVVGIRYSA